MKERRKKQITYFLAGLGLLAALLLISSLGMWMVQKFLDHFDGRKYGEAVALADEAWTKASELSETESSVPTDVSVSVKTEGSTGEEAEEEMPDAVLLDGNRLNDMERLQVLAELSLKYHGRVYDQYLEREPIEEIELSEQEARDRALLFLDFVNASLPSGSARYQMEEGVNMSFRADKEHPSVALWVADFTTYGCIVFLYMDARTGLPVRFRATYRSYVAGDPGEIVYENGIALDTLASSRNWQTGNPVFLEQLFSYLSEQLKVNFYTNPVTGNAYPEADERGFIRYLPVFQWMSDDYRYVLTWARRSEADYQGDYSEFDLVLSPMEAQETVRNTFSDRYGYWIEIGSTDG